MKKIKKKKKKIEILQHWQETSPEERFEFSKESL